MNRRLGTKPRSAAASAVSIPKRQSTWKGGCLRLLPVVTALWLALLYGSVHRMSTRPSPTSTAAPQSGDGLVEDLGSVRKAADYVGGADAMGVAALVVGAAAADAGDASSEAHENGREGNDPGILHEMDAPGMNSSMHDGVPAHAKPAPPKPPPMWPVNSTLTRGPKHPNILFILSDDHSAETVGFRGKKARLGELANTSRLNLLASQGAVVENCFCALALCSPSRASILTGQYPHVHGVTILRGKLKNHSQTYVNTLHRSGYATALFGKWHIESPPRGFATFDVLFRQGNYTDPVFITEEHWSPTSTGPMKRNMGLQEFGEGASIINGKAMHWLDRWNRETRAPFLLHVHYKETHEPWEYPERYEHAIDFGGDPADMVDPNGGIAQAAASDGSSGARVAFGSKIPEPPTLLSPLPGRAGPTGSLAIGWPLENLILRMAGLVKGFTYGRTLIPNTTHSEYMGAVNASLPPRNDTGPMRRLAHRKLVSDYLRTVKHMDDRIGELVDFLDGMDRRNKALEEEEQQGRAAPVMELDAEDSVVRRGDPAVAVVPRPHESFGSIFDNTIVIYTSDQGYFLGEHDLFGKRFMWEPSIRVPCTIRYPALISPGLRVRGQVSNVDWAPLLLDLSSTVPVIDAPPYPMHGKSFRALLTTAKSSTSSSAVSPLGALSLSRGASDDFYYRYYDHQSLVANEGGSMRPSHLGIRTSDGYKLIMYDGLRCWVPLPFELFDLNVDPHESRNLFSQYNEHNTSLVRSLQARLAQLFVMHTDRQVSGSFLPQACGNDYSSYEWKRCMVQTSPCKAPPTCELGAMNRSTLLLLKTRLKYSAQQLCVIMNGVLIGFKLRPSHGTTFFDDRLEKKSAVGEVATAISSEMEAEDSALGGIDGTVDSPRLRLALLDKHANRTLNFLSGEVKLNYLQLKLVAQSVPYLLATPADSVLRPRLRFLEGRLNFSTAQLTRVIAAAPTILNCSTAAVLEPKLGFLEMRLRLTRPQVRKIVLVLAPRLSPPILRTEAATTTTTTRVTGVEELLPPTTAPTELTAEALNEILRHLQSVLDITAPQLRRLVVSTPKLLGLSPVDVSRAFDVFTTDGGFAPHDVSKIVLGMPGVLLADIKNVVKPTLDFYDATLDCGRGPVKVEGGAGEEESSGGDSGGDSGDSGGGRSGSGGDRGEAVGQEEAGDDETTTTTTTTTSSSSGDKGASASTSVGDFIGGFGVQSSAAEKEKLGSCLADFPRLFSLQHTERNRERFEVLRSAVALAGGKVRLGPPLTLKLLEMGVNDFKAWKAPLRSFTMRQSHRMARHLATERLIAFYESKNSQSQVGRVEEIIEKFEGRYDEIFAKLTRKYKGWV